jgi:hypothetical protein
MDDVIATENKVEYNVLIGAQSVTSQEFKAISATPSAMVFNVVVPSLETILDRHVFMQATLTLKISGTKAPVRVAGQLWSYRCSWAVPSKFHH